MMGHRLPATPESTPLTTPRPVYDAALTPQGPGPTLLPQPHRIRARAAAVRAQHAYPGPAGHVLAEELRSYAEMGWMARADSPLHLLIEELLS